MILKNRFYKLPNGTNATIFASGDNIIFFSLNNYLQKCVISLDKILTYSSYFEKSDYILKVVLNDNKIFAVLQDSVSVTDE